MEHGGSSYPMVHGTSMSSGSDSSGGSGGHGGRRFHFRTTCRGGTTTRSAYPPYGILGYVCAAKHLAVIFYVHGEKIINYDL